MKTIIKIIALFAAHGIVAQTTPAWQAATKEEVAGAYQKVWDWFVNTPSYVFHLKYSSYKDHVSTQAFEVSEGYYKRSGKNYISEAIGLKTVQNEKTKMVIDTTEKLIALTRPAKLNPAMAEVKDMIRMLEKTKALKKKKENNVTTYRVEFNKNELYAMYEFSVSEKGYLQSLVYYYSEREDKDYDVPQYGNPTVTKIKPRLEIDFTNYIYPAKLSEAEFTDKSIVLADKGKVTLLNKYKSYEVKDYRFEERK